MVEGEYLRYATRWTPPRIQAMYDAWARSQGARPVPEHVARSWINVNPNIRVAAWMHNHIVLLVTIAAQGDGWYHVGVSFRQVP